MVVETIPPIIGLLYVIVGIPLVAYLWYKGKFSRKIGIALTVLSIVLGFLIFSPMAPFQLQALVLNDIKALGVPIAAAAVVLLAFIIVVLITGRIFCGYLCPIGALQEFAYDVPVKKVKVPQKHALIAIRLIVLLIFLAAAFFFSISMLAYFGIQQFFYLTVASIFFFVFLGILIISLVVYRPFCRLICPLGVFYSLAALVSLFKLRRTQACTDCKKCEVACPTNEAKRGDAKGECYLCGRCVDTCPVKGALSYRRT